MKKQVTTIICFLLCISSLTLAGCGSRKSPEFEEIELLLLNGYEWGATDRDYNNSLLWPGKLYGYDVKAAGGLSNQKGLYEVVYILYGDRAVFDGIVSMYEEKLNTTIQVGNILSVNGVQAVISEEDISIIIWQYNEARGGTPVVEVRMSNSFYKKVYVEHRYEQ